MQPLRPHEHWHVDVTYLNISGTFYYLCSILDGYSRFIVHWEIRETMTEADVETIVQRAARSFPASTPRIISDNGPQFIARDFKEFIRICGMTHVRTSPYYPQSNGKIERWFKTLKGECIRVTTPLSLEDARRMVAEFVSITTRCACTAPSATSRRPTSWPVVPRRSGRRGARNWRRPTPGGAPRPRRRSLLSHGRLSYSEGAWAEDRATRGRDPSADPGAKTGAGGTMPPHGLPGLAQKR